MNTRLSLLMVFLKSLLLAPGAFLSPDLNTSCPARTTISGDEEWANTNTLQSLKKSWRKVLYVHPDPGFKGVRVVAASDGSQQDAWFTLDNTCFPRDVQWWRLFAEAWSRDGFLSFAVQTGDCSLWCQRGLFPGAIDVTIEAHGPSRWRLKDPAPCTVGEYKEQDPSWINCTSFSTTTTTTTTITIIVVPVVIGVAVVVVLIVVVTKCYWQRRESPVPRVPARRGLDASVVAGSQAADEDNYVDPPAFPTVKVRVALVRGQWRILDQPLEDGNRTEPPRGAAVLCDEPPQQEPEYVHFSSEGEGEEPVYDDPDWLPPLQEEPVYDEIDLPALVNVHENVDKDDDYLTPRGLPPGTPSGVIEG